MSKKYPLIYTVIPKKKNTQAKCACGAIGKYKTNVSFNYMRGDDEYYWTCEQHKKDLDFILK